MARLRTLKPEFFTHELLCELAPLHRLLYQGLWCYADREGRLEYRPRYLKTVILPYDDCNVELMLRDLAERGFIQSYSVDGRGYISIPTFLRHQKPHPKERPSEYPPPPIGAATNGPRLDTPAQGVAITMAAAKHGQDMVEPGKDQTKPRKSTVEPGKDLVEPGGLGDLCLGDFGLGEIRRAPVLETVVSPIIEKTLDVYAYYRETFSRRQPEPSVEERDHIQGRLRDGFDVEELCKAVLGLWNSVWHQERGFTALKYALGSRDQVERCLVWADTPPDSLPTKAERDRYDPNQGIMMGAEYRR